jgi:acyl carrier protein
MSDYLKTIKNIIAERTGHEADEITADSYFEDDLNVDEMELVEILSELEEKYQIDLVEEKGNIATVGDLIDILLEKLE